MLCLPSALSDAVNTRLYDCELLPERFEFTLARHNTIWRATLKAALAAQESRLAEEHLMRELEHPTYAAPQWQFWVVGIGAAVLSALTTLGVVYVVQTFAPGS